VYINTHIYIYLYIFIFIFLRPNGTVADYIYGYYGNVKNCTKRPTAAACETHRAGPENVNAQMQKTHGCKIIKKKREEGRRREAPISRFGRVAETRKVSAVRLEIRVSHTQHFVHTVFSSFIDN